MNHAHRPIDIEQLHKIIEQIDALELRKSTGYLESPSQWM